MDFLNRLMSKINGTPVVSDQSGADTETGKPAGDSEPIVSLGPADDMAVDMETGGEEDNGQGSQEVSTEGSATGRQNVGENAQPMAPAQEASQSVTAEQEFDEKKLYSKSTSEQRFAWHKLLVSELSKIENMKVDVSNLKHFSIYIEKTSGCRYQWNDEAFKKELMADLEPCDCASHIGASSLNIEVVSDKVFKKISEKKAGESEFKQQFKLKNINIIFFGSKKQTDEQRFATAIDKRAFVINAFVKKFRDATGTDSKLMENFTIVVVRNEDDNDMAKYDWVGKKFEDDLRREFENTFLDKIGSKSLQVVLRPKSETEGCLCLIENQVYYKWVKADVDADDKPKEIPYKRVVATVSIIEGSGSMMKQTYTLDSDVKKIYHIGRGVTSRKGGKYRVNDIVIKDREADPYLMECNEHVSSCHADIVFKNNRFYLRAAIGGCRPNGGSPTKLVRGEKATELRDTDLLYPLENGDYIELGKKAVLLYTLAEGEPLTIASDEAKPRNAMSIDDSF